MKRIDDFKKVLLFGALGMSGCLLGWAVGEGFLKAAARWVQSSEGEATPSIITPPEPPRLEPSIKAGIHEQTVVQAPDPPPMPEPFRPASPPEPPAISAEFTQRLQREGAHQGDVEIALIWSNRSDLDLHVVDPGGEEIWYSHKKAQSGGELDVDMNVRAESEEPVEHVYFSKGGAPGGHYAVSVECFTDRSNEPIPYKVEVKANGQRRVYEGTITNRGQSAKSRNRMCEFDVEIPQPQIRLSVPESVSIAPDGSNDFRVRIARGYFNGPVRIGLKSGDGFMMDESLVPDGETAGSIKLRAAGSTGAGMNTIRVLASAETPRGHVEAVTDLRVKVVPPPKVDPVLKLSVPGAVQVLQGESNRFKVRVGRYFFASPSAVSLNLSPVEPDLKSEPVIIAAGDDEAFVEIKAVRHAKPGAHVVRIAAVTNPLAAEVSASLEVEVVPRPPPRFGWATVLIIGLWSALLALGLLFLLAMGQNRYLRKPIMNLRGAGSLLMGGVAAGCVSGGGGQMLQALLVRLDALGLVGIPPALGLMAGWCALGLLLGYGVAFFIPNLARSRAALAGLIGGLLGAGGFLALTHWSGDVAGRVIGAAILGFSIGTMAAIAEVVFREAWLEISYGPNEIRRVTLGMEPVSIGGDQKSVTIYARSAAPVAYRYRLKDNAILCEDVPANRTAKVVPGDSKKAGNVTVKVCGSGKEVQKTAAVAQASGAASGGFTLRLSNGRSIALSDGLKLSVSDLPGLESIPPGGPVAQVSRHPKDPKILGLQNLTRASWRARLANGDSVEVKPGKSVTIVRSTRINFGSFTGEIAN